MEFYGPIESFFKSPEKPPSPEGDSILFHLRVDLERLYGKEDEFNTKPSAHIMLSMMGMLAGMDYLSKIYSGKESGDGFVEMATKLGKLDKDNAEALYQLRCALVHSVSLSTICKRKHYRKGTNFIFQINDKPPHILLEKLSDKSREVKYSISFYGLKKCFTSIINALFEICNNLSHPKNRYMLSSICKYSEEKILKEL